MDGIKIIFVNYSHYVKKLVRKIVFIKKSKGVTELAYSFASLGNICMVEC